MNSPKPVPTRGMHTRNQATGQAGTVSRSKGQALVKPGFFIFRSGAPDSLAPLDSLTDSDDSEPLDSLEPLVPFGVLRLHGLLGLLNRLGTLGS